MGCSDCGSKGGCDARKHTQRGLFAEVIARVYPSSSEAIHGGHGGQGGQGGGPTWGVLDDEARFGAGVPRGEVRRLARSIAAVAQAPTIFRAGEPEDLCDYVWVLCVGRRPSLVELRDGLARAEPGAGPANDPLADLVPGVRVEERWLRLCFSSVARLAAMQEVALTLEVGEGDDAGLCVLRESPRPGVFDPILLKRVRKIVALLEASDVAHADFGLLDRPLPGAHPGDYVARYGVEPMLANFLFMAAPSSAPVVTVLPRESLAPRVRATEPSAHV